MTYYCPACEAPALERVDIGCINDDGAVGEIPGVACQACYYLHADPGATPTITGYVDLGGRRAIDWLLDGLRAAGCDPIPWP